MSILSISSAVKVSDQVRPAVSAVARRLSKAEDEDRFHLTQLQDDDDAQPIRFCVLKPASGSEATIEVECIKASDEDQRDGTASWASLVSQLPKDDCRVAIAQVSWRAHSDGVKRERLVFIQWTPELTTVKQRMMASMFSKGVKQTVEQWIGPTVRVEAHGVEDMDLHAVQERIRSTVTVK